MNAQQLTHKIIVKLLLTKYKIDLVYIYIYIIATNLKGPIRQQILFFFKLYMTFAFSGLAP